MSSSDVFEILQIAQKMGEHKDPVAKEVVKHAKEEVQKVCCRFAKHSPPVPAQHIFQSALFAS